jgi:hypothetical protein
MSSKLIQSCIDEIDAYLNKGKEEALSEIQKQIKGAVELGIVTLGLRGFLKEGIEPSELPKQVSAHAISKLRKLMI